MAENEYANAPNMSRSEDIIQSILDNTEYDEAPRSRIEYLLIELKKAIAAGGGGGGVTSYSPLTEKPKIDNHTLQAGNNSSSDLGLQTKLAFDSTPTENSTNPVTSGGVYTALGAKANSADVYNKSAVDTALGAKADKSAVDTALEAKADKSALDGKQATLTTAQLAAVNSGITSTDVAQIGLNKNNISSITNTTAFVRKRTTTSSSSITISYTMRKDDFRSSTNDSGVYLITVVPWGTTAPFTMYALAYSGGNLSYRTATKICGSDITFTFSGGTFEFDTSGLVTIYAMQ